MPQTLTAPVNYSCFRAYTFQLPLDPDERRNYAWVHGKATADSADAGNAHHYAGQRWIPPTEAFVIQIWRSVLQFIGTIPSEAVIGKATIHLYGAGDTGIDTPFDLVMVDGDVVIGMDAYGDLCPNTTSFGSIASAAWNPTGWNEITLNSAGLAYLRNHRVNPQFGSRSSLDISETSPDTGDEYDDQYVWYQTANSAYLYVVFAPQLELRSATETFARITLTHPPPSLSPRRTIPVQDKITLELIRNIEMGAKSRFFINEEGKAIYKSRFGRQL